MFHKILEATQQLSREIEEVSAVTEEMTAGLEKESASITEMSSFSQSSLQFVKGVVNSADL